MTKHIELKHKVQGYRKTDFVQLLDEAMLKENECQMMKLYYIDGKEINFIADALGYSEVGIRKMHKRVLKKLEPLL